MVVLASLQILRIVLSICLRSAYNVLTYSFCIRKQKMTDCYVKFLNSTVNPLSMFSILQPLFLQKKSLYIHISDIYLGLGFEFECRPQRIRDLAFVCP